MITTGLALAAITIAGFYTLYYQLPPNVRSWIHKHGLLTRGIICISVYALFGGTIVSLFAAAFLDIIVSIMLALTRNPDSAAMLEAVAKKVGKLKEQFFIWCKEYQEKQECNSTRVSV